jgi:hypothetical protein
MAQTQQAELVATEAKPVEPQDNRHPIEKLFKSSSRDILDALQIGSRARVDVKGKLAELYLLRKLEALKASGVIDTFVHQDIDGEPDFLVTRKGRTYRLECKNLRDAEDGRYRKNGTTLAYKVEVQKTRNSKDGTNTRHYRRDYIDILAVCLFNQIGEWEFYFIEVEDLEVQIDDPKYLKVMQRVPLTPTGAWKTELADVL